MEEVGRKIMINLELGVDDEYVIIASGFNHYTCCPDYFDNQCLSYLLSMTSEVKIRCCSSPDSLITAAAIIVILRQSAVLSKDQLERFDCLRKDPEGAIESFFIHLHGCKKVVLSYEKKFNLFYSFIKEGCKIADEFCLETIDSISVSLMSGFITLKGGTSWSEI